MVAVLLLSAGAAVGALKYSIKPEKPEYLLGLPVTLVLEIHNPDRQGATAETGHNGYGNFRFTAAQPGAAAPLPHLPKELGHSRVLDTFVASYATVRTVYILDEWLSFKTPGKHQVNFSIVTPTGDTVWSDTFEVNIVDPTEEQLAAVRERYQQLYDQPGDPFPDTFGLPFYSYGVVNSDRAEVRQMPYVHNPALKDIMTKLARKGYPGAEVALKNMP
ncbi:MAG: hypothetical protein AAGK14_09285 [Verrucomicrobiota bacterium]